jgi:hypothetical protein
MHPSQIDFRQYRDAQVDSIIPSSDQGITIRFRDGRCIVFRASELYIPRAGHIGMIEVDIEHERLAGEAFDANQTESN